MNSAPPTILVIDDESHMRRLLQFSLAKTGAKLLLAAGGAEGVERARAERVDLVVVDFAMQGMDGFATIRELRKNPAFGKVPVIMLTSRGQTDLRTAAEGAGIDAFLTKPFSPLELTREVNRLLGRNSAPAA